MNVWKKYYKKVTFSVLLLFVFVQIGKWSRISVASARRLRNEQLDYTHKLARRCRIIGSVAFPNITGFSAKRGLQTSQLLYPKEKVNNHFFSRDVRLTYMSLFVFQLNCATLFHYCICNALSEPEEIASVLASS